MQQPGPSRLHAEISARRQKQPPDVPRYLECCEPALAATIWRRRGAGTGMHVFGDSDDDDDYIGLAASRMHRTCLPFTVYRLLRNQLSTLSHIPEVLAN